MSELCESWRSSAAAVSRSRSESSLTAIASVDGRLVVAAIGVALSVRSKSYAKGSGMIPRLDVAVER